MSVEELWSDSGIECEGYKQNRPPQPSPPVERNLLPLREEREESEVPSWMKARVR